jgi:predicted SprT family Zn-dependent metalloprotease
MNQAEVEIYCRMELKQWKLGDYSIVWKEMKGTLGLADPWNKTIILNPLVMRSTEMLMWIVKHEMAHVLDWIERGGTFQNEKGRNDFHGASWKKWCRLVGVKPDRCVAV